ncbi:Hsp20/alpha crystallin family protein [Endothiovibrio diazotrophicus]
MTIVRFDPFRMADPFYGEIGRFFDRRLPADAAESTSAGEWSPAVDVREEEGRFLISADLPGVDPAAVEVTLEKGVLTLAGERRFEARGHEQGFHRVERRGGRFQRRFALPKSADPEGVEAHYRDGVLQIAIAKRAEVQPRRIEVSVTH